MYHTTVKLLLLYVVCGLLMGNNALAERRAGALTVTPSIGYHMIDGGMDFDDAATFGFGLGYNVTPEWGVEADLRYTPTETEGDNSTYVNIWTISLGGLYHLTPKADLTPYLSFGAGMMVYDLYGTSNDDEDAFGYYGGGIKYALGESTDFRFDVRHILDYRSDNRGSKHDDATWRHHLQSMAGVTYQFGTAPAAVKQESAPESMVNDEVKPSEDNDHDGIFGPQDKCQDTAPGVRVNNEGCPADTDNDGVMDYMDACVDTPKGTEVDQRGCTDTSQGVTNLTDNILFGFDKDQITPFHYSELKRTAEVVDKYPVYQVVVEGHADDRGTAEYNQLLSLRRADSVRKELVDKYGIAAARISTVGFGLTRPIAGNSTAEERMKNRRVEISIHP